MGTPTVVDCTNFLLNDDERVAVCVSLLKFVADLASLASPEEARLIAEELRLLAIDLSYG